MSVGKLIEIQDLSVCFPDKSGDVRAVSEASMSVNPGEIMGVVGESGSGKSTLAYALMRLLKKPGRITGGSIIYEGNDILTFSEDRMQKLRGNEIGMIFQDPMSCLDPVYTIGAQLRETLCAHREMRRAEADKEAERMLISVGLSEPESLMKRYPYELSGGMQQRVMIAMALLCRPKLLIADEATTALDVTVQNQIIRLLKRLRDETGMAILLITHNFGLVSEICDRVAVMYGGRVVEEGDVDTIFYNAIHPYTKGLIEAIPKADPHSDEKLMPIPGLPLDPKNPPTGCPFHTRCEGCGDRCRLNMPPKRKVGPDHYVSCYLME